MTTGTSKFFRWLVPLAAAVVPLAVSLPAAAAEHGLLAGAGGTVSSGTARTGGKCTPALLGTARVRYGTQLSDRETQLDRLQAAVARLPLLTTSDRTTLSNEISGELSGVESLSSQETSVTTCYDLAADARTMIQYRVYGVVTPQVRVAVLADQVMAVAAQMQSYESRATAALAKAQGAGDDVVSSQADLTDLETQVTDAEDAAGGLATSVLAFTPACYPTCRTTFRADLGQLRAGTTALRRAGRDFRALVHYLRDLPPRLRGGAPATASGPPSAT